MFISNQCEGGDLLCHENGDLNTARKQPYLTELCGEIWGKRQFPITTILIS